VLNVEAGSRTGENESWHSVRSRKRGPDGRNPGLCQSERTDPNRQLTRYKKSMTLPPPHLELDQKGAGHCISARTDSCPRRSSAARRPRLTQKLRSWLILRRNHFVCSKMHRRYLRSLYRRTLHDVSHHAALFCISLSKHRHEGASLIRLERWRRS
jgi:hypothetical protein